MRFIALLLLVPVVVFAQQPQGQIDKQQYFQHMKKMMLPMMEKSLPAMGEAKHCVEKSGNSAELNACMKRMAEFQKEMMAMMGMPAQGQQGAPAEPETPELEWSEELKAEIVGDLGKSIAGTTATRDCLTSSTSPEAMDACMSKAGMGAPK